MGYVNSIDDNNKSLIIFLLFSLAVGFFTLVERKVLSYIQLRKGPNKVGIIGLPQPLRDALKLFSKKENSRLTFSLKFTLFVKSR